MKEQFSASDPHRQTIDFIENLKSPKRFSGKRKVVVWIGLVALAIVGVVITAGFLYSFVCMFQPQSADGSSDGWSFCPSSQTEGATWILDVIDS